MGEKPPKNPLEKDPWLNKAAEKAAGGLRKIIEEENKKAVETAEAQEKMVRKAAAIANERPTERLERIIKERKFFPPAEIPAEKKEQFDEITCPNCGGAGLDGACEACGGEGKILILKENREEHEDWLGI